MAYFDDDEEDQLSPVAAVPKTAVPIGTSLMPALAARPLDTGTQGDFAARGPQVPNAAPIMATPKQGPTPLGTSAQPQDQLGKDQARYDYLKNSGSGVDQFGQHHNKFLAGLAHIADAVGGGLFPGIAQAIPGTSLHHQVLLGRAQNAVNEDQAGQMKAAQITNEQSKPELAEAKIDALSSKNDALAQHQKDQTEATLHAHGFKHDESGQVVPLSYDEMSEQQQAVHDLKGSQAEVADAQKALKDAQTKNMPVQMELQKQRIANAQKTSSVALQRLGLSQQQFAARYHGTDTQGNALPGAMELDDNTPVGSVFQQNVRPTGQERNKADLANSAHEQLGTIKDIVQKRPDIFGPAAGRKTDFNVWLGSQDPDAQRFRSARTIAGDHLAGVFGGRSEAALSQLDNAIGQFKDNPKAVLAGIDQLDQANNRFMKVGTPKVANGHGGSTSPAHTNPPSDVVYARDPQGKLHQAPAGTKLPDGWKEEKR